MHTPPDLDRALLRRFEPVLRFTKGEQFFPMDVADYTAASSLWVQRPSQAWSCVLPEETLTLEDLAHVRTDGQNAIYFLKFIEPMNLADLTRAKLIGPQLLKQRSEFEAGRGRLARVGYISRLVDALFSLALLARGRVPGDTAAAAAVAYQHIMEARPHHTYHARVVRQDGWVVLQYWFFYAFNNWRSGFSGANDHESDWEMVALYLSEEPPEGGAEARSRDDDAEVHLVQRLDRHHPEWIAYASHEYSGDDLRRHWDDPEVHKVDGHPVVFVGAGSHAGYFAPGEYLSEIEIRVLRPVVRLLRSLRKFRRERLRQYTDQAAEDEDSQVESIFRIPFVDYARGDGAAIGPGQAREWDEPCLLDPTPGWVTNYRGLWGLYTRDWFSGEDAPAGPMYNRDGTVRRAWYDPVGWAGLDKTPPLQRTPAVIQQEMATLRARQTQLEVEIHQRAGMLTGLGAEAAALRDQPHLAKVYWAHQVEIDKLAGETDRLRAEVAVNAARLEALALHLERLRAGDRGPLRAHIRRAHRPASDEHLRTSRFIEFWSAVSVGLSLLICIGLALFAPHYLLAGLIVVVTVFAFIEASVRGYLTRFISGVTAGLAVVAALVIGYEFFREIVFGLTAIAVVYILWDNLREVWR